MTGLYHSILPSLPGTQAEGRPKVHLIHNVDYLPGQDPLMIL